MSVREPTVARERERRKAGVIDTLSAGYGTVNRHLWILAVPLLVDLFFWVGPRLTLAPLVQRSFGRLPTPSGLPADLLQSYQDYRDGLLRAGESFNLFSLLVNHIPGIPNLMSAREGTGSTTSVGDPLIALVLLLGLLVAGLGLASIYYLSIGGQLRGDGESAGLPWSQFRRTWRRLLGFLLLMLGVSVLFGLPVAALALLAGSASMSLLSFTMALFGVTWLWVQFYLFFVVDAVVISDVGPLQAIRNSVAVVKFNLGSTLALVVLIWVITMGMPIIWDAMAQSPAGTIAGILGNAYISSGLAAASMIYYRDRFAALNPGLRT